MRVILVFFLIAFGGVGGLFWLVHGRPPALDSVPALPTADSLKARIPELPSAPLEPAQPVGSELHKCIEGGRITYTDQPCKTGAKQKALDPERSRISTVEAQKQPGGKPAAAATPPASSADRY